MKATHIIWRGAGSPDPCETNGDPIPKLGDGSPCAACGEPGHYRLRDAISDNFTTVKNSSRAWPFGGDSICAACVFACKTLALRLALSFSRENGVWFIGTRPIPKLIDPKTPWMWDRPDGLSALLNPPEPPFVAMMPLAGMDHGGESNLERAWWPNSTPHERRLERLQSKHVAIYARVGYSRERYPLQVDDHHDIVVDVPVWTALRVHCDALLLEMRQGGVGANDARDSLCSLRPPPRCPVSLLRVWGAAVEPLRPHSNSSWWRMVFVNLLGMPELVKTPKVEAVTHKEESTHAAPAKRNRPGKPSQDPVANAQDTCVPAPRLEAPDLVGRDRGAPVQGSLF